MKYLYLFAALSLLPGGAAMAQGVGQAPSQTVTQQRQQNGGLVSGGTAAAVRTNPASSGTNTTNSPFVSPFGGNTQQKRGGYTSPY